MTWLPFGTSAAKVTLGSGFSPLTTTRPPGSDVVVIHTLTTSPTAWAGRGDVNIEVSIETTIKRPGAILKRSDVFILGSIPFYLNLNQLKLVIFDPPFNTMYTF